MNLKSAVLSKLFEGAVGWDVWSGNGGIFIPEPVHSPLVVTEVQYPYTHVL